MSIANMYNLSIMNAVFSVILVFTVISPTGTFSRRAKDHPFLNSVPDTDFTCRNRPAGYYADPQANCQAYHMCDTQGKQFSYLCPNYTLFNQKFMVCDHWYVVNCSNAEKYYHLNLRMGQGYTRNNEVATNTISNKNHVTVKDRTTSFNHFKNRLPPLKHFSVTTARTTTTRRPMLKPFKISHTVTRKPFSQFRNAAKPSPFSITPRPKNPSIGTRTRTSLKQGHVNNANNIQTSGFSNTNRDKFPAVVARGSDSRVSFGGNAFVQQSIDKHDSDIILRPLVLRPNVEHKPKFRFQTTNVKNNPNHNNRQSNSIKTNSFQFFSENNALQNRLGKPNLLMEPPTQPFQIPIFLGPSRNMDDNSSEQLRPHQTFTLFVDNSTRQEFLPHNGVKVHNRPNILHSHMPTLRGHRHFFIPTSGLSPPAEDIFQTNFLQEHDHKHQSNSNLGMTMVFPQRRIGIHRQSQQETGLVLNPACPHCHPAFLRPGQCTPCVRIR